MERRGRLWRRTLGKNFQVVSQFMIKEGKETARHSQRSTLDLGRTDVRDFAKNGCDCMARGQLERIAKVSQLQFSWCKFKRS